MGIRLIGFIKIILFKEGERWILLFKIKGIERIIEKEIKRKRRRWGIIKMTIYIY